MTMKETIFLGKNKERDYYCRKHTVPFGTKKWECLECSKKIASELALPAFNDEFDFQLPAGHPLSQYLVKSHVTQEVNHSNRQIFIGLSAANFLGDERFSAFADVLAAQLQADDDSDVKEPTESLVAKAFQFAMVTPEAVDQSHSDTQTDTATIRAQVLDQAKAFITQDRNSSYGGPEESFQKIAALWSVYFGRTFIAAEVSQALALLKLARLSSNPGHLDSWIDLAGYAACGAEVRPDTHK